jgi:hypothetical protein
MRVDTYVCGNKTQRLNIAYIKYMILIQENSVQILEDTLILFNIIFRFLNKLFHIFFPTQILHTFLAKFLHIPHF